MTNILCAALCALATGVHAMHSQRVQISVPIPTAAGLYEGVWAATVTFPAIFIGPLLTSAQALPSNIFAHASDLNGEFGLSERLPTSAPEIPETTMTIDTSTNVLTAVRKRSKNEMVRALTKVTFINFFEEPEGQDIDLNSLRPLCRALSRYGLNISQIEDLVRIYEGIHAADDPTLTFHDRLLGIRAANLMAQYLAGVEKAITDSRVKRALIIAALFHRTVAQLATVPDEAQARALFEPPSAFARWLRQFDSNSDISERDRVWSLVRASYSNRADQHSPQNTLADYFNPDLSRILQAIMQFVTRASMFADGPAFAQAAARARMTETRTDDSLPNESEAMAAAAAETGDLLTRKMPAAPDRIIALPDGPLRNNLSLCDRYFRGLVADAINRKSLSVVLIPVPVNK